MIINISLENLKFVEVISSSSVYKLPFSLNGYDMGGNYYLESIKGVVWFLYSKTLPKLFLNLPENESIFSEKLHSLVIETEKLSLINNIWK